MAHHLSATGGISCGTADADVCYADADVCYADALVCNRRYLLRHRPVAGTLLRPPPPPQASARGESIAPYLRHVRPLRTFLRILRRFQVADPVLRQRGEHVRYESKIWQRSWSVVPLLFDLYLQALSFLYTEEGQEVIGVRGGDGGGDASRAGAGGVVTPPPTPDPPNGQTHTAAPAQFLSDKLPPPSHRTSIHWH